MLSSCQHIWGILVLQAANVLVSDTGHVFLADFGLACNVDNASSTQAAVGSTAKRMQGAALVVAASGEGASRSTLVGTTAFMAPEVINAGDDLERYDQRVPSALGPFLNL